MTCETCETCGSPMPRPFLLDKAEREMCETCAGYLCSLGCGCVCPPGDRLPFANAGKTHAHFNCLGRAQRALGWELTATLIAKRGPRFRGAA